MASLRGDEIVDVPLADAVAGLKGVPAELYDQAEASSARRRLARLAAQLPQRLGQVAGRSPRPRITASTPDRSSAAPARARDAALAEHGLAGRHLLEQRERALEVDRAVIVGAAIPEQERVGVEQVQRSSISSSWATSTITSRSTEPATL